MKEGPVNIASVPLPIADRRTTALTDYLALTKPRLNLLVVATSSPAERRARIVWLP